MSLFYRLLAITFENLLIDIEIIFATKFKYKRKKLFDGNPIICWVAEGSGKFISNDDNDVMTYTYIHISSTKE